MAKSLQEQLLAAGLADEKKAKQVRQQKRKAKKQQKQNPVGPSEAELSRQRVQQAQEEKAARDREINRRREAEAEQRALQAQIRQLVEQHRLDRSGGDTAYNFVVGRKVKKIYVTTALCDQLARGRAAIVGLGDGFHVVPAETAGKVLERDAGALVIRHQPKADDDDDPYADFPIPDDLMW